MTRPRAAWQVGGTIEDSHARHAAAARQSALPGDPPRQARHLADQCRLSLQPVLLPLPRQCRAEPHRGNAGGGRRPGARFRRAPAHRHARHHRRRARTQRQFPPPGDDGAQARRQGDGPLQSHHPGAAGPGRPGGVSGRAARRNRRVDALLSAGQCRAPARQGRVRRLDPRPEKAQRARLRPRSGAHAQPRLQSARPGAAAAAGLARGRLQARAGRALRHRVQQIVRARQHADPALRHHADQAAANSTAICICCRTPISTPISTA